MSGCGSKTSPATFPRTKPTRHTRNTTLACMTRDNNWSRMAANQEKVRAVSCDIFAWRREQVHGIRSDTAFPSLRLLLPPLLSSSIRLEAICFCEGLTGELNVHGQQINRRCVLQGQVIESVLLEPERIKKRKNKDNKEKKAKNVEQGGIRTHACYHTRTWV